MKDWSGTNTLTIVYCLLFKTEGVDTWRTNFIFPRTPGQAPRHYYTILARCTRSSYTGCCRPHASKSINKAFGTFFLESLDFFGIKSLLRIWQKRPNYCFFKFLTSSHLKMYQSKAFLGLHFADFGLSGLPKVIKKRLCLRKKLIFKKNM